MDHQTSPKAQRVTRADIHKFKEPCPRERVTSFTVPLVVLIMQLGDGTVHSSSTISLNISNVSEILNVINQDIHV